MDLSFSVDIDLKPLQIVESMEDDGTSGAEQSVNHSTGVSAVIQSMEFMELLSVSDSGNEGSV